MQILNAERFVYLIDINLKDFERNSNVEDQQDFTANVMVNGKW